MNLGAIIVGYLTAGVSYQLGVRALALLPALQNVVVVLGLELLCMVLGGYLVARLSGPVLKQRKANAGMMGLLAGCMQIVANGGGVHWVRFLVILLYVPAAVWGAGRHRR